VLLPFSIVLIAAMPWVLSLLAPGLRGEPATFALAIEFGRIAFPYLVFISLASLYGGVLNGIERFAEVAVTPVLLNVALIGAVLGLTPFLPNGGYAASIGVAIGGLLQWLWLLASCARDGVGIKLVRPRFTAQVARLIKLATPVAIGGGVQTISVMLDVVWASLMPVGTISALYYADRLAQLPLGVVGIAIGTALLPLLARQLRAAETEVAMANQNRAIEFGLLFSLPAALALWQIAEPVIRVLFERGRFLPDDTLRTAGALAAFAVGLPAFVLVKALTPGFFAREDTRTPLYIAIASIAANIALNALFLLATSLNQVGIALASSLAGWLNAALLGTVLMRRGHLMPDARLLSRAWRMAAATVGMGLALWLATLLLRPALAHSDVAGFVALAATCIVGALAYAGLGAALGVVNLSELRFVMRRQPGLRPAAPDEQP
jgi:putative peptidoglycan lipid II flippase